MDAIVLAAGYATRLAPYTTNFPKPLLRVGGEPLLNHTVRPMLESGRIDRVIVITNARFLAHFTVWGDRFCEEHDLSCSRIQVLSDGTSTNEDRLGSIGDLAFAAEQANVTGDVLVTCADKLFTFSLADLIETFEESGVITNVCCDTGSIDCVRNRFGCVEIDEQGRILSFEEKPAEPRSSIQSIAFYVYPASILGLLPTYLETESPDAPGNLLRWLLGREAAQAWLADVESCADVGAPASYELLVTPQTVVIDGTGETAAALEAAVGTVSAAPETTLVFVRVAADQVAATQARFDAAPGPVPVNAISATAPAESEQLASAVEFTP